MENLLVIYGDRIILAREQACVRNLDLSKAFCLQTSRRLCTAPCNKQEYCSYMQRAKDFPIVSRLIAYIVKTLQICPCCLLRCARTPAGVGETPSSDVP